MMGTVEQVVRMLERVVVAAERMAAAKEEIAAALAERSAGTSTVSGVERDPDPSVCPPPTTETCESEPDPGTAALPPDDVDALTREDIKAELRKLGVPFGERQATTTLTRLLQEAEQRGVAKAPVCVACGDSGVNSKGGTCVCQSQTVPASTPEISYDDLLTACKAYADVNGTDSIRKILNTIGGAATLGSILKENYPAVMAAVKRGR